MNLKAFYHIIISFIMFSFTCFSQNHVNSDSIEKELKSITDDSVKAEIYNQLCWKYREDNLELATQYGLQALSIYSKKNQLPAQCNILNKLGVVKRNAGEYSSALELYFKILHIAVKPICNIEIAYAYENIGDIYHRLEKYEKAFEYANKAYDLFQSENHLLGIAYNYQLKANINFSQQKWKEALNNYRQSINIRLKINHKTGVATSWIHFGNCYMKLNMYDSAFICYKNGKELYDKTGIKNYGQCYIGFAKYFIAKKNYRKAIENLNIAFEIAKKINRPIFLQESSELFHLVYFELNDYKKAYEMQTIARATNDSLKNTNFFNKVTQLELNFEFEQKNKLREIEELKKKAAYESQLFKQELVTYSLIIITVAIMIISFIIFKNYRYIKHTNSVLHEKNLEITEHKTAIESQNEELQALNATKDKFFSIIGHDLKNPFTAIIGFSRLLIDQNNYNKTEIVSFLRIINESAQNAYKLLENLLVWARAQTGNIDFNPQTLILEDVILEIINISISNIHSKDIQISYEVNSDLTIFADKNMIHTILRNLLSNAIKYTHRSGCIKISAEKILNEVKISVTDDGVGIEQKQIDKLFKIHQKTSTAGTENEEGTGLGLLLCKEFVEKHQGNIWVESEVNKGSKFSFTIPDFSLAQKPQ